jgi:Baseplate J-like protein
MIYTCCNEHRRAALRDPAVNTANLNGIDFLEVVDAAAPQADRQRLLRVHFVMLPAAALKALTAANVEISGGVRITGIEVQTAAFAGDVLEVQVSQPGDFSTYTLRLVGPDGGPLDGLDPQLAEVAFSFKVECPSDFDCRPQETCPPGTADEPEIDYLAKDYLSFRQLMLDRMTLLLPDWTERSPADLGVVLVELLAHVGDQLSYRHDAFGTEAYLGTARHRISVRRHARLVDYAMHDGCNARTWAQVRVAAGTAGPVVLKKKMVLLTTVPGRDRVLPPGKLSPSEVEQLFAQGPVVFETMADATLYAAHNDIFFYTFGDTRCCLPRGATRAALLDEGRNLKLQPGDMLAFVEKVGPDTGDEADADPTHRQAVRLTCVTRLTDPLYKKDYLDIEWADEDALSFPLCLSAVTEETQKDGGRLITDVSVALGNLVLADHGRTLPPESLPEVPEPDDALAAVSAPAADPCTPTAFVPAPVRYRPRLAEGPLTQAAPLVALTSAAEALRWDLAGVLPVVELKDPDGNPWGPQRDLLGSDAFAAEFVAEVDNYGRATLRFGDNQNGIRPAAHTTFTATYRVGNGVAGNIAADSLRHIITDTAGIDSVTNPLPAMGGVEPESIEHVRQSAPFAYRLQQRAVTEADHARAAERHPQVLRAVATFRWTGSWRTVFVAVQRRGGRAVDDRFRHDVEQFLERFRMAGQDVVVEGPSFVALEVELSVCVEPTYYRGDVRAALLKTLGGAGLFAPDRFTFGQPVYLSPLVAAAQGVAGVRHLTVTTFQRLGRPDSSGLTAGRLDMGPTEIALLANDSNFPERGVLRLSLEGGR